MGNDDWESRHSVQPTGSMSALGGTAPTVAITGIDAGTTGAAAPLHDKGDISKRVPYVHKRVPRRTQDAIDDLAQNDLPSASYTHDSNISVGGRNLSGRGYRRSRSGMSRFQENNRYGQYLEMPKGQRSIFASREQERRRRSLVAVIAVLVTLTIAALIIWRVISTLAI